MLYEHVCSCSEGPHSKTRWKASRHRTSCVTNEKTGLERKIHSLLTFSPPYSRPVTMRSGYECRIVGFGKLRELLASQFRGSTTDHRESKRQHTPAASMRVILYAFCCLWKQTHHLDALYCVKIRHCFFPAAHEPSRKAIIFYHIHSLDRDIRDFTFLVYATGNNWCNKTNHNAAVMWYTYTLRSLTVYGLLPFVVLLLFYVNANATCPHMKCVWCYHTKSLSKSQITTSIFSNQYDLSLQQRIPLYLFGLQQILGSSPTLFSVRMSTNSKCWKLCGLWVSQRNEFRVQVYNKTAPVHSLVSVSLCFSATGVVMWADWKYATC